MQVIGNEVIVTPFIRDGISPPYLGASLKVIEAAGSTKKVFDYQNLCVEHVQLVDTILYSES
jgi:hypothetical protein